MKKIVLLYFLIFVSISCESNKKYQYVETIQEIGTLATPIPTKEDPEIINAKSDSAAFIKAFRRFCSSQKFEQDFAEAYDNILKEIPLSFKLLDEEGNNIANTITFKNKDSIEKAIKKNIFSEPNSILKRKKERHKEKVASLKVDTVIVKKLKPYFEIKTNEFAADQKQWYTPKSAPRYINKNSIHCYFAVIDEIPRNFRIKIQYYDDDWLFINKYQFSIDGKAYEFYPDNIKRDNGDSGHIWEWCDDRIELSDTDLIKALANAKNAKIKFVGKQYSDVKKITKNQIKSIKRTLELYKAMGGTF